MPDENDTNKWLVIHSAVLISLGRTGQYYDAKYEMQSKLLPDKVIVEKVLMLIEPGLDPGLLLIVTPLDRGNRSGTSTALSTPTLRRHPSLLPP